MYKFEINKNRDEMTILRNGKPVYKAGYHPSMNAEKTQNAFADCVLRLETQLIGG